MFLGQLILLNNLMRIKFIQINTKDLLLSFQFHHNYVK